MIWLAAQPLKTEYLAKKQLKTQNSTKNLRRLGSGLHDPELAAVHSTLHAAMSAALIWLLLLALDLGLSGHHHCPNR